MPAEIYVMQRTTENPYYSAKLNIEIDFLLIRFVEGMVIEQQPFACQGELEETLLAAFAGKTIINGRHPVYGEKHLKMSAEYYKKINILPKNQQRFQEAKISLF